MKTTGIVSFCIGAAMIIGGATTASADHRSSRAERYGLFQDDRAPAERAERPTRGAARYGLFEGERQADTPTRRHRHRPRVAHRRDDRRGYRNAPADYVWIPGSYEWRSKRWVWVDGYWTRARPGYRWLPARWVQREGGYARVGGYWVEDGRHVHIHHHRYDHR